MQEDIQHKSVVLVAKTTELTARGLAKLIRTAMRRINKSRDAPKQVKQTVRQLAKGGSLQNIDGQEISDNRRYMMLGNSVAIPCVVFVLGNIAATAGLRNKRLDNFAE